MAIVFFSYSHSDEGFRDQLETHLAMLKRQGVISTWHDRRLVVGDDLNAGIRRGRSTADLAGIAGSPPSVFLVLIVTP